MTGIFDKLKPYLVYPSTIGSYHARPLPWLIGNAPTHGQALYILGVTVLNLILTFVGYDSVAQLPHPWGYNRRGEWLAYAGYRTGDISFALLPLTVLFAGRNNILLWETNWSHSTHEYWLYAACAVWFFEGLIRVLCIAKNGMRRAVVTEVGDNHVRVDIPGLRWSSKSGYHAYAYFPTLKPLKLWENHRFSVNSTAIFASHALNHDQSPTASSRPSSEENNHDVERFPEKQNPSITEVTHAVSITNSITLIIRKNNGMRQYLKQHANLLTLIDGPYRNNTTDEIFKCDGIILIGGGIGITGLLSWATSHPNTKLLWSLKESNRALLMEVEGALARFAEKVIVGQRLDVRGVLEAAAQCEWKKVGVVACRPGGLCDDMRAEVVGLRRWGKWRGSSKFMLILGDWSLFWRYGHVFEYS
ncbi:hypothetical protein DL98DRAFT_609763 [Cadophora sp. DSE1049]|nr:hypothetical protein DL98DRAFT_609763 [Cadophora sp. DSE1049]